MKYKWSAQCFLGVALLYSTATGVCQNLHEKELKIRFRLVHETMIVVSLMAGNQGPFDFVLDTGADLTILDPSLAGRLSLVPLRLTQQTTLAGNQTLRVSLMPTLSVGPAQVSNLPVMIQDLSGLRKEVPSLQGIVGQNFLSHFNYLLDYRRQLLHIEQDNEIRAAIDGEPLPIETRENRMIVATQVPSGGMKKLRLILDSGASSLVLMRHASPALDGGGYTYRVALTPNGAVQMQMGTIQSLLVGEQRFHDLAVALTDIENEVQMGDGLLPTALFQVLYVNNREGFVVLNPRRRKN